MLAYEKMTEGDCRECYSQGHINRRTTVPGQLWLLPGSKMLRNFIKYFISNYEKMKLSMSLMLGIVAIIFLIFYLIGCLMHLWEYNIINVIFNPIAGSILVCIPLFLLIILLRFFNYFKTRTLFYKIIRSHRNRIKFSLQKDYGNKSDDETKYILWGNYKDIPFRFSYSLGHPLQISLVIDMRNYDISSLNELIRKLKLRGRRFSVFGLTLELKKPFAQKNINRISEELDTLMDDFQRVSNKMG